MRDQLAKSVFIADTLREEFDHSFSVTPGTQSDRSENLLAVRIGGERYAIRIDQVDALHVDRVVVALPSPLPELLGLVSFRGQLAPVYDLGALLGYSRRAAPRWIVLARWQTAAALAFDMFEAHLRVPREHITVTAGTNGHHGAPSHLRGAVRCEDGMRPIVDLCSVLEHIQRQVQAGQLAGPPVTRSDQS